MQVLPQCGHAVHEDAPDRVGASLSPQRSFFHPDDVNVPRDRNTKPALARLSISKSDNA